MIYTLTPNPALDKSYIIESFEAGKVNRVLSLRRDPGGKGINVSKTIRSLGGKSVAMGIVGGESGKYILKALQERGIECDFVLTESETRTNIKISDPVLNRTTDINEGANATAEDITRLMERLLQRIKPGDYAVLAGRMDTAVFDVAEWIRRIQAKGAMVCLDTEGEALKAGASAAPFLIKPNEPEFRALTGRTPGDIYELSAEAQAVAAKYGIRHVIVSLGEKGALFACGESVYHAPAIALTPVSTVGAGDAMCAALCHGFNEGMNKEDAYRLALAASAAAVLCPGSESPAREQVNQLLPKVQLGRIL